MASVDHEGGALAERNQANRMVRSVDPNQRFGADLRRDRDSEQGMADAYASHVHGLSPGRHSLDELGLDPLDAVRVAAQRASTGGHCDGDEVDPEDFRPAGADEFEKLLDRPCSDGFEDRRVDRRDRARMAAGEGDQRFIRLFGGAEPLAQASDGLIFELDYLAHRRRS